MTNPTLCQRAHPHLAQSPHCDLREVSAFLTQRAALGTAISPDDLKSMAAQIDRVAAGLPVEAAAEPQPHPDDLVVNALAAAMKAKLSKKRDQGYGGRDTDCTQERLSDLLRSHVDKGDPLDVANYCAFLHARREGIAAVQQAVRSDDFKRKVYEALGVGDLAAEFALFENIRNLRRRTACLDAIEREFFMVETPPDEDEGDTEPGEECLLNWGHEPEQYVKQFEQAIAAVQQAVQSFAKELAEMLERSITGLEHYRDTANWSEADEEHIAECNTLLECFACVGDATRPTQQGPDPDGEAFRTAAKHGLTLRFYGVCAQSSAPGTPSAYEVVTGNDVAAAMREAVQRAATVIDAFHAKQGINQ